MKKKFQELVKAYKRVEREMRRRERDKKTSPARWSNGPILMDPMTGCSVRSGLPAREGYFFESHHGIHGHPGLLPSNPAH